MNGELYERYERSGSKSSAPPATGTPRTHAAIELLFDHGYHRLTMTDVAARAGVSKATLYRRWTAKADLVADAVATLSPMQTPCYLGTSLRDDLVTLMNQIGRCDGNPAIVNATYEMARSHPDLFRSLTDRFQVFLRGELEGFAVRATTAGHTPLSQVQLDLLCDAIVALLAHHGGPAGVPITRDRLIDLVDHVLLVLLTGTRSAC